MPVYVEPKLLNRGANQHSARSRTNTLKSRGETKEYIVARLKRDGKDVLAEQVNAGTKSARQAAIEAGFKVPESQLTILKRAWVQPVGNIHHT